MDPGHRGWSGQTGGGSTNAIGAAAEQIHNKSARSQASYGTGGPQHSPTSAPALPPPGSQYQYQQPSHNMPSLPGIHHSSPRQASSTLHRPDNGPPQQGAGFSLPALSQATGQASLSDRERERAREVEQIHIKEEADRHHREVERQRMEQVPSRQTPQGPPIHLHQPVAVGTRTVHGPNGLLAQPGISGPTSSQSQFPMGAPNGPSNAFPAGIMNGHSQQQQNQPGMLMPFLPGSQPPPQQAPQGQGQQPILNDALSYLDQVKVQFSDHPDVYNRFLDIMKDFKGGVIDTPGVIGRVSQLFAGNPGLIQGFNTFLPPGYRIECGEGDDPNVIRVTTPAGTSLQSIPGAGVRPLSRQDGPDGMRRANGIFTPQPGAGAQLLMSPSGRAVGPVVPHQQYMSSLEAARQHEQLHQQQERGVSSLQNAASSAAASAGLRAGMSPVPGRATPGAGNDAMAIDGAGQAGLEKRGPVEFNHAISYVNKIKNRFAAQPDIYKQFLEILQTYQRESKPIQDVYSQVTHLFKTAPDLLDDFKQFLPETAAQAKAAMQARQQAEESAMLSNLRGEPSYASPVMSREVGMGTPNHGRGLPPVGNFAPTPNAKDNKRKRGDRQGTAGDADAFGGPNVIKQQVAGPAGKRMKQNPTNTKVVLDQPPTSPTLIPALPSPLPPTSTSAATHEELSFFDRAKKVIGNKNTFNEFLKLCNLFSQDLIDRTTLVHRAKAFIGGNFELMKWFQEFVGYDEREILIENKPRIPGGRVNLSNCRGLGPSYRLLPKRERNKPCGGRDELCREVLNDDWASHPTWASEDSGFIAHKKNHQEEGLHRIEEERHDYDFNIETIDKTIQLLQPLAQQLRNMSDQEQREFELPPNLGGSSEAIYQRVVYKCYGRNKGAEIIKELFERPWMIVPVLLNRLIERQQTWKMARHEWNKVWQDQTQKMFWKSLDHQAHDPKKQKGLYQAKTLQQEINVRRETNKLQEQIKPGTMHEAQLEFTTSDKDVIIDATHLIVLYLQQSQGPEATNLVNWIVGFVAMFYGFEVEQFRNSISERREAGNVVDEMTDDKAEAKGRKPGKSDLRRDALDPTRRADSLASGSRASTPAVATPADAASDTEANIWELEDPGRWTQHPATGNTSGNDDVNPDEPRDRHEYTLWTNAPVFIVVRMFIILYERLTSLKQAEATCVEIVKNNQQDSPAADLGLSDRLPADFFEDTTDHANYYVQMLHKFEDYIRSAQPDFSDIEETLRRYYLSSGYGLYSFDKLMTAIARSIIAVEAGDNKEKSKEIVKLYEKDRVKDTTTAAQDTEYRTSVEKLLKDSELYKIVYNGRAHSTKMWLVRKGDPCYDALPSSVDQVASWRYYIASYTSLDPTVGIDAAKLQRTVLIRNLRAMGVGAVANELTGSPLVDSSTEDQVQRRLNNTRAYANLVLRIAVNTYRPIYEHNTADAWSMNEAERGGGPTGVAQVESARKQRSDYMAQLDTDNAAISDLPAEDVEAANEQLTSILS